jgi:hypothetical protein
MKATVLDLTVVSADETYHGWPTIGQRRNGELLIASSSGRRQHVCPFGEVRLNRSSDAGQTWSAPAVVVDGPLDDRDAGVMETAAGTLLVAWFTSLCWLHDLYRFEAGEIASLPTGEDVTAWRAARERLASVDVRAELGSFVARSEDGGKTWSEKIPSLVSTPHGPVGLADSRLLYVGRRGTAPGLWGRGCSHINGEVAVAESLDDGRTWSMLSEVWPYAEGEIRGEPHMVEAADGRLIVQIRCHGGAFDKQTAQCESDDGGRTWTQPHSIGVDGFPSHLLRLQDDRLLMVYGVRYPPYGNRARVSDDHGRTWSTELILSDDGANTDLGYPSSVQLDDGTIVSVWYEKLDGNPNAVLRQARWRID